MRLVAMIQLRKKWGPLYTESKFKDTKDPCPVFDGAQWHIFGSGGSVCDEKWKILHAIAPALEGPWVEDDPVKLDGLIGDHVAAPGVMYDAKEKKFHMFIQTDFLSTNGTVEYLTSTNGCSFQRINTALTSIPDSEEAGIYDPHPAVIRGKKYIVYSGTPRVIKEEKRYISRPDIFLAQSKTNTWNGPWIRKGKILDHHAIAEHHNQPDSPDYEWGIEGPQLIELTNRSVLLNATCFLPTGRFGTRQRTFFALGETVAGPYKSLGPVLQNNLDAWESGENGHAACILQDNTLYLFYQARSQTSTEDVAANDWRYGIATFDITPLLARRIPRFLPSMSRIKWQVILPHSLFRMMKEVIQKRIPRLGKRLTK